MSLSPGTSRSSRSSGAGVTVPSRLQGLMWTSAGGPPPGLLALVRVQPSLPPRRGTSLSFSTEGRGVGPPAQASSSGEPLGARGSTMPASPHACRVSPACCVHACACGAWGHRVTSAGAWSPVPAVGRVAGLVLDLGSAGVQDLGSLVASGLAAFSLHLQGMHPLRPWRFWGPLCTPHRQKQPRGPASGSPPWSRRPALPQQEA